MNITLLKHSPSTLALSLPVSAVKVSAGIGGVPSPSNDYAEEGLDLNQLLIKRPAATYFAWATGHSMIDVGISDGDLLIVDRSVKPTQNALVVAVIDGEYVCKILDKHNRQLLSANGNYPPYQITEDIDCVIEGVITGIVKQPHVRTG